MKGTVKTGGCINGLFKGLNDMKKIIRTAGILTMVFAASVAVYFFAARKNMQKEEAVYSSMDAPEFPVVYTEFDGKEINALHGYIQDM